MQTNTPMAALNRNGRTLAVVYAPHSVAAPVDAFFTTPEGGAVCHVPQRYKGASWQTEDMKPASVRPLAPEECPFPLPETWRGIE